MADDVRIRLSTPPGRPRGTAHGEVRRRWTLLRSAAFMVVGCVVGLLFALQPACFTQHDLLYFYGVYTASLLAVVTGLGLLLVVVLGERWRRATGLSLLLGHGTLGMLLLANVSRFRHERLTLPGAALVIGTLFGLLAAMAASAQLKKGWLRRAAREALVLLTLAGASLPWAALVILRELQLGHVAARVLIVSGATTAVVAAAAMRLVLALGRLGGAGRVTIGLLVGAAGASAVGLVAGACLPTARLEWGALAGVANAVAALLMLFLVYENKHKLPVRELNE